jgi:hypothetical protein
MYKFDTLFSSLKSFGVVLGLTQNCAQLQPKLAFQLELPIALGEAGDSILAVFGH